MVAMTKISIVHVLRTCTIRDDQENLHKIPYVRICVSSGLHIVLHSFHLKSVATNTQSIIRHVLLQWPQNSREEEEI
jgi:hypothetical protein